MAAALANLYHLVMATVRNLKEEQTENPTLVSEIAEAIGQDIIVGLLRPGARLNTLDLATRFRSSRTPIREALAQLTREGLVELLPRRGARVSTLSLDEARQIYQVRAHLNALVATLLVERNDPAAIAALREMFVPMRDAADRGDREAYFWGNVAFRDREAELCGNAQLRRMLDTLRLRTSQLRHLALTLPERLHQSRDDHERLLQAYERRDALLAYALNRALVLDAFAALEANWHHLGVEETTD